MASSTRLLCMFMVAAVFHATSADQMSWKPCSDATEPIKTETVTLTPDPPVIGGAANFLVHGISSVPLASGTVDIDVSFGGVNIFSQSEDLCSKTQCPTAAGPVDIKLVENLPPIAPPGDYGLRVTVKDASDSQLLCLDVNFTLVFPFTSTATGSATEQAAESRNHLVIARKMLAGGAAVNAAVA